MSLSQNNRNLVDKINKRFIAAHKKVYEMFELKNKERIQEYKDEQRKLIETFDKDQERLLNVFKLVKKQKDGDFNTLWIKLKKLKEQKIGEILIREKESKEERFNRKLSIKELVSDLHRMQSREISIISGVDISEDI